jgi:hypothetical protein
MNKIFSITSTHKQSSNDNLVANSYSIINNNPVKYDLPKYGVQTDKLQELDNVILKNVVFYYLSKF